MINIIFIHVARVFSYAIVLLFRCHVMCTHCFVSAAGPFVSLTLLGRSVVGTVPGGTPKHLEESSASASVAADPPSVAIAGASSLPGIAGTLLGPLTGNPVLDRERISGPQAVDVSTLQLTIDRHSRIEAACIVL